MIYLSRYSKAVGPDGVFFDSDSLERDCIYDDILLTSRVLIYYSLTAD
jgi:hypothetical protein